MCPEEVKVRVLVNRPVEGIGVGGAVTTFCAKEVPVVGKAEGGGAERERASVVAATALLVAPGDAEPGSAGAEAVETATFELGAAEKLDAGAALSETGRCSDIDSEVAVRETDELFAEEALADADDALAEADDALADAEEIAGALEVDGALVLFDVVELVLADASSLVVVDTARLVAREDVGGTEVMLESDSEVEAGDVEALVRVTSCVERSVVVHEVVVAPALEVVDVSDLTVVLDGVDDSAGGVPESGPADVLEEAPGDDIDGEEAITEVDDAGDEDEEEESRSFFHRSSSCPSSS
ncbi:hypothetical protein B0H15DRAFT_867493 [Mycena belliarum]|uniref:Uncharacterized protein n=1 Tax=Mycena belliarum TaxID=1033014 RepID=A0AAD6TQ12_9AGAR|nr:hypothetical protein B0H15DRAFT_867493 [Mycena belliae]